MLPIAVLAGGLATRLGPVTQKLPKAMIDINGEPFIAHQLRLLQLRGIRRVVVCAGHLGGQIKDFVGTGAAFGVDVVYSFDGPVLRGTAGAIHLALTLLAERFFVVYGDSYLPCDYARVQKAFESSGNTGLMTVFRNRNQWDSSNVEFADGRILRYDKNNRVPSMQHIDYGLGVFRRQAFDRMAPDSVKDLAQIYQELLARDDLAACEMEERFYEIGSFAGIEELRAALRAQPGA